MRKLVVSALAMAAVATGLPATADAKKPTRTLATPAATCRILVDFGAGGYGSFRQCMRHIHRDVAAFRFPSDEDPNVLISLNQRCAGFESEFLTYPFTFTEDPPWPFPTLTAQNRRQCMNTLYAYHTLTT